jgi:hypothetical protein
MNSCDLHWFAGLMEGEGSFGIWRHCMRHRRLPQTYRYPRLQLMMTDKDVVARAADLLGVKMQGPYGPYAQIGKLPVYRVACSGRRAVKIMQRLRPHMSKRRRAQIDRAIVC